MQYKDARNNSDEKLVMSFNCIHEGCRKYKLTTNMFLNCVPVFNIYYNDTKMNHVKLMTRQIRGSPRKVIANVREEIFQSNITKLNNKNAGTVVSDTTARKIREEK